MSSSQWADGVFPVGSINYASGNVGIGKSSPLAKLDVGGNIIADTPTASNHVATKNYVDGRLSSLCTAMG